MTDSSIAYSVKDSAVDTSLQMTQKKKPLPVFDYPGVRNDWKFFLAIHLNLTNQVVISYIKINTKSMYCTVTA